MRNILSAFSSVCRRTGFRALFVAAFIFVVGASPDVAFAQLTDAVSQSNQTAQAAGITAGADLITIIGRIINVLLGFVGIVLLLLLLYAGYTYMTAAGDKEKVTRAVTTIRNAIIGLIIIASAWAITAFIFGFFAGEDFGGLGGSGSGPGGGIGGLQGSSGSLGNGLIESVFPAPNSTENPRNTSIMVTFKEPIYPGSFIAGWTDATSGTTKGLNADNIKIYRVDGGEALALTSDQAYVFYTKDLKTFVIKPVVYLGSPSVAIGYKVELNGGSDGIKLNSFTSNGSTADPATMASAFAGAYSSGYEWQFEVSTVLDLTPPTVVATIPPASGGLYARNIVIQLNFSKAMDPTTVSGLSADLGTMEVLAGAGGNPPTTPVPGEFRISNQYRTVEFVTESSCGTNSCGREVFCLPADASIQVTAKAASVDSASPPSAILTNNGYDGVVSAVGNSLDGGQIGGNGLAEGPPGDNFVQTFATTNEVKLLPPQVESTTPDANPAVGTNSNVPLDQPVVARFDSLLQASTLNSENAKIVAHGVGETNPDTFWFMVGMRLLNADGSDFDPALSTEAPSKASVVISHRTYLPSGTGVENLNYYDPYLLSGIQDAYQNCFNPAATCGSGKGNPNCCKDQPNADPLGCKNVLQNP